MSDVTGLQRHYSAGPRHAYCWTYANPAEVGPLPPLDLQFWIPKGRKGGQWVAPPAALREFH